MTRVQEAIAKERKRCLDIMVAARNGEIDSDLRVVRYYIERGLEVKEGQ